uniref:Uncharacterized protein n=1 Tax=Laticauda laticaudata TaxID=8630 RepID=A0A8C5WZA7_LATLA
MRVLTVSEQSVPWCAGSASASFQGTGGTYLPLLLLPLRFSSQVTSLQRNTSEVLYHSLSDRDLQIAHWKQENETLKKSHALTTGLVTSLQKDVVSKEQRIQQLKTETEKLRQESWEKDSQLAYVSAQVIKPNTAHKQDWRCLFRSPTFLPHPQYQIVEEIRQAQERQQSSDQKEAGLQKEVQIKALEMEKLSSNLALLKKLLDGFQASFSAKSLKGAISQLQSLAPLAPPVSGIQASLARILYSVLGWVEALESLLRNMGIDAPAGDTGPSPPPFG